MSKSVDIYEEVPLTLLRFDSDKTGGLPVTIGIRVSFSYDEEYIKRGNEFFSLGTTSNTKILVVDPAYKYQVQSAVQSRLPYYNSSDNEIFTARLLPINYPTSIDYSSVTGGPFHNSPFPAHSKPGVIGTISNGFAPAFHETTARYN